jgi:hypothetical protein
MALKKREKILAVAAGVLLLATGGRYLLPGTTVSLASLRTECDDLTRKIDDRKKKIRDAEKVQLQLDQWQKRSLPTDQEIARSAYQNWLTGLTEQIKLQRARVESGEPRQHRGIYRVLPFTVRGQATFEQLVRFLHSFYSAGNLDQIRHVSIKPVEHSQQDLEVVLSIEALSLPGADRREKLTSEPGNRLARGQLDDYLKTIVQRKLFSPYTPTGEKVEKPEPPKFDVAKFAYLTGVVDDGRPQAWFKARATDQQFMIREGESFTVGSVNAKLVRIGPREVELEIDGARHVVSLGANLREPEGKSTKEEPKPSKDEEQSKTQTEDAKSPKASGDSNSSKPEDKGSRHRRRR